MYTLGTNIADIAADGSIQVLVVADLSNIEARMLAWVAQCTELLSDYRDAVDINAKTGGTTTFTIPGWPEELTMSAPREIATLPGAIASERRC